MSLQAKTGLVVLMFALVGVFALYEKAVPHKRVKTDLAEAYSRFMEPFDVPSPAEVPLQPLGRGRVPHATHRYKVRPGDSLGRISAKMLGSAARWREIARLNRISDPQMLRAGQVIKIPARQ